MHTRTVRSGPIPTLRFEFDPSNSLMHHICDSFNGMPFLWKYTRTPLLDPRSCIERCFLTPMWARKAACTTRVASTPHELGAPSLTLFYRQSLPTCHMALPWLLYDLGCTHTGRVPLLTDCTLSDRATPRTVCFWKLLKTMLLSSNALFGLCDLCGAWLHNLRRHWYCLVSMRTC